MEFKDYKPEELIGKTVLVSSNNRSSISTIERVTKTAFQIKGAPALFNLSNGWMKGCDKWNLTQCSLITEDQANEFRKKWGEKKEGKVIIELFDKLKTELTIEQLRAIKEIIQPHISQKEL